MIDCSVREVSQHEGEEIRLHGWLRNKRSSGKLRFLIFRDGTGDIQVVVSKKEVPSEVWDAVERSSIESSIVITGVPRADARAPSGYEMSASGYEVVQLAEDYPIAKKEHGVEFLLKHRHLWLRSSRQQALMRVRATLIRAIRDYLDSRDYVLIDSPILTPTSVEGTTTLFEVDYHGDQAFLSQSGQLYLEPACQALGKVYCFGPAFRAEKSKTKRHLLEFWMVEPEVAYLEFDGLLDLVEDFVVEIVGRVVEERRDDLDRLERDISKLEAIQKPFPRMHYDEAVRLLNEAGNDFELGGDLGAPDERLLCEQSERPILLHHFPAKIKSFYMQPDAERAELALGVDVLAPEGYGEIIGGGQRIHDLALLEKRLSDHGLDPTPYQWYLDVRRYGAVPHSGFGLGIERAVAWIAKVEHLRETIPFPRMLHHMYP